MCSMVLLPIPSKAIASARAWSSEGARIMHCPVWTGPTWVYVLTYCIMYLNVILMFFFQYIMLFHIPLPILEHVSTRTWSACSVSLSRGDLADSPSCSFSMLSQIFSAQSEPGIEDRRLKAVNWHYFWVTSAKFEFGQSFLGLNFIKCVIWALLTKIHL